MMLGPHFPVVLIFGLLCFAAYGNAEKTETEKTATVDTKEKGVSYSIAESNKENSTQITEIDWSQRVVVLHNRPEFRIKMEDKQTQLVAISVLCDTPDAKYKVSVDTADTENGFLPEEQRQEFFIACRGLSEHTITKPLVNSTGGYRSISFRLPTTSQNETAESIVNEWLSSSLFQSSSPEYFDSRPEHIQREWKSRAKAAAELFLEGGRDSPSPRVAQVVNITVVADLIGRTRLRFLSSDKHSVGFFVCLFISPVCATSLVT